MALRATPVRMQRQRTQVRANVRVAAATVAVCLAAKVASACPVCFGASDGPMLQGSNMGIAALLVVTVAMLGAFVLFGLHLARRAKRSQDDATRPAGTGARLTDAPRGVWR